MSVIQIADFSKKSTKNISEKRIMTSLSLMETGLILQLIDYWSDNAEYQTKECKDALQSVANDLRQKLVSMCIN